MTIILCPGGFCGMSPKAGATVAAVYMILVTNMYLIFEVGHLERAMTDMAQIKPFNLTEVGKMLPYCYYTAIMLAVKTYPVCVFLIYSVHKWLSMGMFAYVAWIIFYDLANCLIVAVAYQVSKEAWFPLSPLEWFGLATRIPMDCFWLAFVVTSVKRAARDGQDQDTGHGQRTSSAPTLTADAFNGLNQNAPFHIPGLSRSGTLTDVPIRHQKSLLARHQVRQDRTSSRPVHLGWMVTSSLSEDSPVS
ncbi:hypothetical protein KIL84_007780 [Mauremys mutica]|uniref:Uncharacterized protein n=1 Tax=Mauremys mutica TaxID=74926 RepID=A0A9D3X1Y1_9SAUR|nr:hypothetical protein KIL84_007780 [Mauremys mutica]